MSATLTPPVPRTRRDPVRLSYDDGHVIVTPADKDKFFITAKEAIQACQKAIREQEISSEFEKSIIIPLRDWCLSHSENVLACYLPLPESFGLPVYVIGKAETYDFGLSRDVADLAVSFADRGWTVDTHLIPNSNQEELCSMFDVERSIQVYGD